MYFNVFADDKGMIDLKSLKKDLMKYGDIMKEDEFSRIAGELKKSYPEIPKDGKYKLDHFMKMMFVNEDNRKKKDDLD